MTAPRETGGEPYAWAVLYADAKFDSCHFTEDEARLQKEATDAECGGSEMRVIVPLALHPRALATPRPVEVTNGLWWALKRLNEEAESARFKDQAYIGDSTVLTSDVETVCAALTAALRAQPAGGTPSWCEEVNEGRSRCSVQCRACELLENAAASTLPPVGERGNPEPFLDTPLLAAKRRAFDSPTQANLDALIECALASRPSPAPSGERYDVAWDEVKMLLGRANSIGWDSTGCFSVNTTMGDARRLDAMLCPLLEPAAPHPDGAA